MIRSWARPATRVGWMTSGLAMADGDVTRSVPARRQAVAAVARSAAGRVPRMHEHRWRWARHPPTTRGNVRKRQKGLGAGALPGAAAAMTGTGNPWSDPIDGEVLSS